MKTRWTWAEWQAGRAARRARSEAVAPGPCGRAESSSDRRLRAAYDGRRGPSAGDAPATMPDPAPTKTARKPR